MAQSYPPRAGSILGGRFKLDGILYKNSRTNAIVYLANDIFTSTQYAIKALRLYKPDGSPISPTRKAFQKEEIVLHFRACEGTPRPPNIVPLHRTTEHPDCTYLVLDYYPRGDLSFNIMKARRFVGDNDAIKTAFLQLLDAVKHCHDLGIYHRDLKPDNIFVAGLGRQPLGLVLGDFGLATRLEYSTDCRCVGSRYYMSPECIVHEQSADAPAFKCPTNDIWSLGIILVNLASGGKHPWKKASLEDTLYRAFIQNRHHHLKSQLSISEELIDILCLVFEPDREKRMTLSELRQRVEGCRTFVMA